MAPESSERWDALSSTMIYWFLWHSFEATIFSFIWIFLQLTEKHGGHAEVLDWFNLEKKMTSFDVVVVQKVATVGLVGDFGIKQGIIQEKEDSLVEGFIRKKEPFWWDVKLIN